MIPLRPANVLAIWAKPRKCVEIRSFGNRGYCFRGRVYDDQAILDVFNSCWMVVFSNCGYPFRVDRMDVEIGEIDFLVFFNNRRRFESLGVKFKYQFGLEV